MWRSCHESFLSSSFLGLFTFNTSYLLATHEFSDGFSSCTTFLCFLGHHFAVFKTPVNDPFSIWTWKPADSSPAAIFYFIIPEPPVLWASLYFVNTECYKNGKLDGKHSTLLHQAAHVSHHWPLRKWSLFCSVRFRLFFSAAFSLVEHFFLLKTLSCLYFCKKYGA